MEVKRAYPNASGVQQTGSTVATIAYDGLNRRISKAVTNSADWDATYHYYYDGQRLVEERNGSDCVIKQYVWGEEYVDELLQIAVNDDPSDETEQACETTYYALQDANYNVIGLTDASGTLVERYEYSPYGLRTVYRSYGSNDPLVMAPVFESQSVVADSATQPYGLCDIGHQGLYHDKEFQLVYNRARYLSPRLRRFIQRDPLGYIDGPSLYAYVGNNPINFIDPFGYSLWDDIKQYVTNPEFRHEYNNSLGESFGMYGGAAFNGLGDAGRAAGNSVADAIRGGIRAGRNIANEAQRAYDAAEESFRSGSTGPLEDYAKDKAEEIADNAKNTAQNIIDGVKNLPQTLPKAINDAATAIRKKANSLQKNGWQPEDTRAVGQGVGMVGMLAGGARVTDGPFGKGTTGKPNLPPKAWSKNAPKQVTPGTRTLNHTKYNSRTGQWEHSTISYDQYGRQIYRTDYTNHGYPHNHTVPHNHSTVYNSNYPFGFSE